MSSPCGDRFRHAVDHFTDGFLTFRRSDSSSEIFGCDYVGGGLAVCFRYFDVLLFKNSLVFLVRDDSVSRFPFQFIVRMYAFLGVHSADFNPFSVNGLFRNLDR